MSALPSYFEAAERSCGFVVIDNRDGDWIEGFASLEHAQSYAFQINAYLLEPVEWLAAWKARRPDPARVERFYRPLREPDVSVERLLALLDRSWLYDRDPGAPANAA